MLLLVILFAIKLLAQVNIFKLLFVFYVFSYQKEENLKTDDFVNKPGNFSYEMRKYASFDKMNMILATIRKAQLLSFDS